MKEETNGRKDDHIHSAIPALLASRLDVPPAYAASRKHSRTSTHWSCLLYESFQDTQSKEWQQPCRILLRPATHIVSGPCSGSRDILNSESLLWRPIAFTHSQDTLHVRQHPNARVLLYPDPVYNLEHSRLCSRLCASPSHLQRTHPPQLLLQHPQFRHLVRQTFSLLPAVAENMSHPGIDQQT